MSELLFVVESAFAIKGRGLGAVGFKSEDYWSLRSKIGEEVELRKPDGTSRHTRIVGADYPPSIKWMTQSRRTPNTASSSPA